MSIITDKFGREITEQINVDGAGINRYTLDGLSIEFPFGTPQEVALKSVESMAPLAYVDLDNRSSAIMALRDQKITGGYAFQGIKYQTRADDRENIAGAAQLAFMAMVSQNPDAVPGNYRWHGGDSDFAWIAEDNTVTPMDAQTVVAFAKEVAEFKSACIFYARYLKETPNADYNVNWPG